MYAKILGSHMAMINGAKIEQFILIYTRFIKTTASIPQGELLVTKILVCTI